MGSNEPCRTCRFFSRVEHKDFGGKMPRKFLHILHNVEEDLPYFIENEDGLFLFLWWRWGRKFFVVIKI